MELTRIKRIQRRLYVVAVVLIETLLVMPLTGSAQTYDVGAMQGGMTVIALRGEIQVSDSTAVFVIGGQTSTYQITNKANQNIYLTDGTMLHTLSITQWAGKTKGFQHTLILTFIQDKRLSDASIIYYCNKRD